MIFGRIAGDSVSTDAGAALLQPAVAPSTRVGIDVAFVDVVNCPVDPIEVLEVELSAIRLSATTCESDSILCGGSVASDVPTECVAALVEVVESDEDDVVIVLPLALSTMRGLGVFGIYSGC